mmetsp:Transcript_76/g.140  ORF Transcript_76/g.140 Transcript_76/m.140 type:complete len:271 (+) Transcript_76:59-871(+)
MESVQTAKLVLVGNGSVGKTSIIQRFQDDGFKKLYKQTVGCDFFEKTMDFRGKTVKTQIWDIGGQSLSSKNLPNYVLGSSVLFLCYDVTDSQSFGDLVDWLAMIRRAYDEKNRALETEAEKDAKEAGRTKVKKAKKEKMPEIYCVGNKIDLIEFRRVTERQHNKFVQDEGLKGGFFVSAGSGENVLTVFYQVAARVVGIELTAYELEFTKKVLAVAVTKGGGDDEGKMKGSEDIEKEDGEAHEDILNMLKGGGGGGKGGGCAGGGGCAIT